mmetsp:Transcript_24086/g.29918  ORF Transcript_24086/g.29918 Transcript_24086/m.29918 type:complete len:83 (+) Transcript_24086:341-589(+)
MPYFSIGVSYLSVRILWHIYSILILQQHYINKRDGRGDAKHQRKHDLPSYVSTAQSMYEEISQANDLSATDRETFNRRSNEA